MKNPGFLLLTVLLLSTATLLNCSNDGDPETSLCSDDICEGTPRNFLMGFSTWPYAPTIEGVDNTYQFIETHSDIYSEHIDSSIPWNAWINDTPLPESFVNDINGKVEKKIPSVKLALSVSILNNLRTDLATDFDGATPSYQSLDDSHIEEAYVKHLSYLVDRLNPDYFIIALEVNELLINSPEKWEAFKSLMANVRTTIRSKYPRLPISESITLHNFYEPPVSDPTNFIGEIADYANAMDFASISYYPFFKAQKTIASFQQAFDFLHQEIEKPIAFSETGHLSENLQVEAIDLFLTGNETEQNDYLNTLLKNAQEENYEYFIWWTHRDYNELWNTFPEEVKDLGSLWLSTGIVNEDGNEKLALETWNAAFDSR